MPLKINLKRLEAGPEEYRGRLSINELDMDTRDDLIRAAAPMKYCLSAEFWEKGGILLSGTIEQSFRCECARCLKPFEKIVLLSPWRRFILLKDKSAAIVDNNCVDLTPALREDIFLSLPRHPLCAEDCRGMTASRKADLGFPKGRPQIEEKSSAWTALDGLNLG